MKELLGWSFDGALDPWSCNHEDGERFPLRSVLPELDHRFRSPRAIFQAGLVSTEERVLLVRKGGNCQ